MAGEFRIPIVLDFTQSLQNVQSFRRRVEQELVAAAKRGGTLQAGATPRAITGQLAGIAAAGRAAVVGGPALPDAATLTRVQREQLKALEAEIRTQAKALGVRAPSEREISRSQPKAFRELEAARAREAKAAERSARAAEREAAATERRAARAEQQAAARAARTTIPPGVGKVPGGPEIAEAFGIQGGIPTARELDRLRGLLTAAGQQDIYSRLGAKAGIGRTFGLNVGLAEERDEGFRSRENLDLRTQLTIARRLRELEELSEVERALIANERRLLELTAARAVELERRQLATRGEARAQAGTGLDQPRADERLGGQRDRARVGVLAAQGTTEEDVALFAQQRAAQHQVTNATKEQALHIQRETVSMTVQDARVLAARKLYQRAVNEAAQRELNASLAPSERGTLTQRIQANIAARQGGPPRLPTEFLNLRQLLTSRALTTASFAASGALLYGSITAAKELITEATELQKEFAIVESQLETAGDVGGRSFKQIRTEIFSVARATGVMANEVAKVTRQLAGAFADDAGTPDFGRALTEARSAFELSRVTGLPFQEVTDSMTAVTLAFEQLGENGEMIRVPFEQIGDTIIGLEQRFGVLAPEIVKFTADLAPLGAELGFTVTQLSALGAVAQQVSGKTGGTLAEQFGRILPALADRGGELLLLFQQNQATAAQVPTLARALAQRDLPAVLEELVRGYSDFSAAQQNALVSLVGSRREAASFYALLSRGNATINALGTDPEEFAGRLEDRFESFSQTVQFSFEQAQRAFEQFGAALFQAGLADALALLGNGLTAIAAGANQALRPFLALNDVTGGWSNKIAGLAIGLLAFNKVLAVTATLLKAAAASRFLAFLRTGPTFLGRGAAAGAAPAGQIPGQLSLFGPAAAGAAGGRLAAGLGAARGFAAANAPGLTLIAAGAAKALLDQGHKNLQDGAEFLAEQTDRALAGGLDPAEAQRIADEATRNLGVFERANLFIHSVDTMSEVVKERIAIFTKELVIDQLEAIRNRIGAVDVAGIIEDVVVEPSAPAAVGGQQIPGSLPAPGDRQAQAHADRLSRIETGKKQLEDLIRLYEENPADLFDRAQEIIEAIDDPALRRTIEGLQENFDRQVAAAARGLKELEDASTRLASESTEASVEQLREGVRAGTVAPERLIAALKQRVADLKTTINGLRQQAATLEGDDRDEMLRQAGELLNTQAQLEDEIEALVKSSKVDPVDLRIRIRSALGGEGVDDANLRDITQLITELEGVDPAEQLNRVFEGIDLLAKIAEAAGKTSFTIPPEWRRILIRAQVPALIDTGEGERVAKLIGTSIDVLGNRIVEAINAVGLDASKIIEELVRARKAMLERALRAAYEIVNFRVRESRIREITGELGELAELEDLLAGLIPDVTGGVLDPGTTGNVKGKDDADDLARRIAEARLAVARARAAGDPVKLAQIAQQAADVAAQFAKDEAERLQALASRIEADRSVRDAIHDIYTAEQELLVAIANAAGDTVAAAELQLGIVRDNLRNLLGEGADPNGAAVKRLRAEIVGAEAAARDAKFQDQLGDIDFLLEMERITTQHAIRMLEAMLAIPGQTEEMVRTIERRIKQLRDEVSADFQFNLPSELNLPTLYEVRRLNQSQQLGQTGYNDNRQINVNFVAYNTADAEAIANTIIDQFGRPSRFGTATRPY